MTRSVLARRPITVGALAALFVCMGVSPARAEDECTRPLLMAGATPAPGGPTRVRWPAPLDRAVTVRAGLVPLRGALDRIAAAARLRLSYSRELLPLDRRVCLTYADVPVGDILSGLLDGTGIEPVAIGNEQVVLAPQRRTAGDRAPLLSHDLAVRVPAVLTPVVVRDERDASRPLPAGTASTTIAGARLVRSGVTTLAQLLNGAVPGVWVWGGESPAGGAMAQYGSLRGASSFGIGAPKVYIDGIEMANPLMLTQLDPATVERVDVLRGPQGGALYGSDAIDGVIRITTRHGDADGGGGRVSMRSETGMTQSGFAPRGVLSQDHALTLRAGSAFRSASLGLGVASMGAFIPGAGSRRIGVNGSARFLGSRGSLSAMARLSGERVANATSPLLAGLAPGAAAPLAPDDVTGLLPEATSTDPQRMNEYTLGVNASMTSGGWWTHTVVAGVDGYRLRNVAYDLSPAPTAADSALHAARGASDRLTLRATSTAPFGGDALEGRTTFSADVSLLRRTLELRDGGRGDARAASALALPWRRSVGLTSQLDATLWRTVSLTGGVRVETDNDRVALPRTSVLPMVGAALTRGVGGVTMKLRGAWGKAVRQPQLSLSSGGGRGVQLLQSVSHLDSEQQVGFEGGIDLEFGDVVSLHVTRFDQRASNLIQAVAVAPSLGGSFATVQRSAAFMLQNVGEITNRGWELQGSAERGALRLDGSLSLVDSRVAVVSDGYRGDLRAGDRMLQVPARVGSLAATWGGSGWSLSMGASRAWDWVNYDRLSLAQASTGDWAGAGGRRVTGNELRSYWRRYDGVSRLRASVARDFFRGVALRMSGENLLGSQRGEPDNVTVVPGRTLRFGFTTRF